MRNEIKLINIDILKAGGPNHNGYSLVMNIYGGCSVELKFAKYQKDLIPILKQSRKALKTMSINKQFEILHIVKKLIMESQQ